MFIHRIRLKNLLSFGPKGLDLELKPLNVLIGPNGSGKSNFIEAVGLLKAAPRDFREPILEGGGVGDWIWRGAPGAMSASVEVVVDNPQGRQPLRYGFEFAQRNQHFWMVSERLEEEGPCPDKEDPRVCFEADEVMATINYLDPANGNVKQSKMGHDGRSVLSKLKDPNNYPEITFVGNEFDRIHLYTDMNAMSQEIREKADRVWLPQDAEKPLLLRYDPSLDPIMRIGLHGPHDLYALRYLAEHEIKRELEALAGVAAVKIKGGLEEEIHVALNERQISVMGLDINQINNRLAQNNVNLPGGNLREGQVEYLIRTLNEFATVDEIAELIVARQGDADIYLRDIAEVVRSHKDREIITRVNGKESVEIEIYKEGDANIVAVAERVRNTLFGLPEQREYVEQKAREAQEMAQRSEEQKKQEGEETKKKQEAEKAAGKKNEEEQQKELQAKKQEEARKAMEHLRMTDFIGHRLPPGAKLELLSDQSGFIKNSISEVQISAIIGGRWRC